MMQAGQPPLRVSPRVCAQRVQDFALRLGHIGRAPSRVRLPLAVSRIALIRLSGCDARSITPPRSKRPRLRVSVVWSMASRLPAASTRLT